MISVVLMCAAMFAADPNPTAEESIVVTVVGTLRTGIVAIGGETTGTTITAKGIKWELDFEKNAELRADAEKLNGKSVTVSGTLERRVGIEIRERWIVTVTSLDAIGTDGVSRITKPDFQATTGHSESRIKFLSEGDTTVFDITSAAGIDKAIIKREVNEWPKTILVRLHLAGLESFKAGSKEVTVEWSVSSTAEHEARLSVVNGKRVAAITKDSPYYGEVRIVGSEKTIPQRNGYFEVTLPTKLFEGNPQDITLQWIDFYRN